MSGRADLIVRAGGATRGVCLADVRTPEQTERADARANAWIKALRSADVDGVALRDRFTYRGDSLWWFAEVYLHKRQVLNRIYRAVETVEPLLATPRPEAVRVVSDDPVVRHVAWALCRREGIRCEGRAPGRLWRERLTITARAHYYVWRAMWSARAARGRVASAPARVAAFVHAAFWRGGAQEQYVGPVLRELSGRLPADGLVSIALGPRTSYRARTWQRRVAEAGDLVAHGQAPESIDTFATRDQLRESRAVWIGRRALYRALTGSAGIRHAAVIGGCDLWPLIEPLLLGVAYLQFPWSTHVMDQLGAALDATTPAVAVTYAEAGGWGRALALEARRRGVATVGIQHGFIYRHWMNYHHEADEMAPSPANPGDRGFPAPTVTLLFDELTAAHLTRVGHFPATALAVTGSATLDSLAAAARTHTPNDLDRFRREAGCPDGRRMVLVAAKFTQIADVFGDLVRALADVPDAHVVVKCHPAEGPEGYLAAAGGNPAVTVAPRTLGLAALIQASDLLVTVNSTASIEAMTLGVPTLVVGLPNNLSPFVDAGVMDGVVTGGDLAAALRGALRSSDAREAWRTKAEAFMARAGIRADGGAVRRAADAILAFTPPVMMDRG